MDSLITFISQGKEPSVMRSSSLIQRQGTSKTNGDMGHGNVAYQLFSDFPSSILISIKLKACFFIHSHRYVLKRVRMARQVSILVGTAAK